MPSPAERKECCPYCQDELHWQQRKVEELQARLREAEEVLRKVQRHLDVCTYLEPMFKAHAAIREYFSRVSAPQKGETR